MAISRVQFKGTFADNTTSITLATDSNVTSGNLLVIYAMKYSAADTDVFQVGDISKSAGTATVGTFTLDVEHVYDAGADGMFCAVYSVPITGTGSCTIQIAGAGSGSYLLLVVEELSGADVSGTRLAGTNEATGNNTTPDSGTVNSGAAAIFCGCVATYALAGHTFAQDGAFTQIYEQESVDHATGAAASRIVSSTTTDSASWTIGTAYGWVAVVAVYKESSGGITGTASVTLDALTTSAAGTLPIAGASSMTIGAATVSATGTISGGIVGEAAMTLGTIAVSGAGTLPIVGAASMTIGALTTSAWGAVLTNACVNGVLTVSGDNARYFANDDGILLLAGFHTWYNVQDGGGSNPPSAFDWEEFRDALGSYGCNFTKLWASLESARDWGDPFAAGFNPQYFSPTRYERTGPGTAADGGAKFDLTRINREFMERLHRRAIEAGNRGIYLVVQLFQGWQIGTKGGSDNPWTYHPYRIENNINSVDGDDDDDSQGLETHWPVVQGNNVLSYQEALVEAIIDRLNHLDNVIWEISNEDTDDPSGYNSAWQEAMIAHIAAYEGSQPKQHLIGRTVQWPDGENTTLDASDAAWVSYNASKADTVVDGTRVSAYDTDHTVGITSDFEWVWTALCEGHGGVWYMDEWDGALYGSDRRNNATYQKIRAQLGYALTLVSLMDLADAVPQPLLSDTGFCLADTTSKPYQYLAYQDASGAIDINVTAVASKLQLTWLRVADGTTQAGSDVTGGAVRTITPPWLGEEVTAFLEQFNEGVATLTIGVISTSGAGTLAIAGASAMTIGAVTVSATGTSISPITGEASMTLDALSSSATGTLSIAGASSMIIDVLTTSANGTLPVVGASSMTLDAITASGAGALPIVGAASMTIGAVVATGTINGGNSGEASMTIDVLTVSANGRVALTGTAAVMLAAFTITAAGSEEIAQGVATASISVSAPGVAFIAKSPGVTFTSRL